MAGGGENLVGRIMNMFTGNTATKAVEPDKPEEVDIVCRESNPSETGTDMECVIQDTPADGYVDRFHDWQEDTHKKICHQIADDPWGFHSLVLRSFGTTDSCRGKGILHDEA